MNGKIRKSVSWMACFAVAMHAILFDVAMQPVGATVDPFSIICHSGPASASEPTPANQTPAKVCDHCNLCFVAGSLAGLDAIPAGYLTPPSVLQILTPASSAARAHFTGTPNRARGPPRQA